jgi:hypothetical protein
MICIPLVVMDYPPYTIIIPVWAAGWAEGFIGRMLHQSPNHILGLEASEGIICALKEAGSTSVNGCNTVPVSLLKFSA